MHDVKSAVGTNAQAAQNLNKELLSEISIHGFFSNLAVLCRDRDISSAFALLPRTSRKERLHANMLQWVHRSGLSGLFSRRINAGTVNSFDIEKLAEQLLQLSEERPEGLVFFFRSIGFPRCFCHSIKHGKSQSFAKISRRRSDFGGFENEQLVLRRMNGRPFGGSSPVRSPLSFAFSKSDDLAILVTEAIPSIRVSHPLQDTKIQNLVRQMSSQAELVAHQDLHSVGWYRELNETAELRPHILDLLNKSAQANGLKLGFIHGDFGPHHAFHVSNQIWIIDWEHANFNGPVLTDVLGILMRDERKLFELGAMQTLWRSQLEAASNYSGLNDLSFADLLAAMFYRAKCGYADANASLDSFEEDLKNKKDFQ
jgi:hypothetical protein